MQAKSLQYTTYHWNFFLDNCERTKITEKGQKKSSDIWGSPRIFMKIED